jgi:transcriptional regulator with XRE-family HTH domain
MNDKSDLDWIALSDEAIEKVVGRYIKKIRQAQRKTQQQLADEANISRSTLSLLERGETGSLKTLIQVLRVLDKLSIFQIFNQKEQPSPLALAKMQHKKINRIRPSITGKLNMKSRKSNW